MFVQVCLREHSALPAPGLTARDPFSSRVSFQLAGHSGSSSNKLRTYLHLGENTPFQICLTSNF